MTGAALLYGWRNSSLPVFWNPRTPVSMSMVRMISSRSALTTWSVWSSQASEVLRDWISHRSSAAQRASAMTGNPTATRSKPSNFPFSMCQTPPKAKQDPSRCIDRREGHGKSARAPKLCMQFVNFTRDRAWRPKEQHAVIAPLEFWPAPLQLSQVGSETWTNRLDDIHQFRPTRQGTCRHLLQSVS
jgi:hypothetical protein